MKEIKLDVITPARAVFSGNVKSITLPGTLGNFQILYNHAPLMSSLEVGVAKILDSEDKTHIFSTSGGTVEVSNNKVIVLAETFERPEDIDVERAKEAKERAKLRISKKSKEEAVDLARAEVALKRAINRLKLSSKYNPNY
ncbi:MAG: F0F1 ATP synthase subunit epsilon [Bacteroidetes bacterium]|nr:F0F1 ATP synthase subunit epsilon [Bacteroidota bacterium]MBU1681165.1 F0F1 ATP synthase subunit epsilon [Bacteroidota bacterium]MBU2505959.1 F0F1 ATP synthase subunit epsilon [Bacteroidota bacterium]